MEPEFLNEITEQSKASQDAKRMGLDYYGYGRYGKNGTTTHISRGGNLIAAPQQSATTSSRPTSKPTSTSAAPQQTTQTTTTAPAPPPSPTPSSQPTAQTPSKTHSKGGRTNPNTQPQGRPPVRFRRRFKLAPGVALNVNQSGIGISMGVPGMQLTIGHDGERHIHLGIPGTGLYRKIDLNNIKQSLIKQGRQNVNFRKRIKLGPGLYGNLSRSGMGIRFGAPGLQVTQGPTGGMVHLGIPGTGVYKKFKYKN